MLATEELICECGAAQLTTRNIAERAGVPIGSFYQYFADREAIVRTLVDRYYQQIRQNLKICFSNIDSQQEFEKALKQATKMFATFFEEHKTFQELWFGAQQWQPLREIDIQDTLLNADALYESLAPLTENISNTRLKAACIAYCDITGSLTRLALRLDRKEKERILLMLDDLLITHVRTIFD